MEFNDEQIKATILYHLKRKRVIGGVHTPFDTLRRGFPSHLGRDIKDIAKELIKDGFLVPKPTLNGLHVSLNRKRLNEIDEFIKRILGIQI